MGNYGDAAVRAVGLLLNMRVSDPKEAWEAATAEIFGKGKLAQLKGCPRNAFLGLCEEGVIKGVPSGNYTRAKKNRKYAVRAVQILRERPDLLANERMLWSEVLSGRKIAHNQQMDVVTSLWENNLIAI